ncbi:hypothetical protein HDU91_004251 [Kappamyces sp. JEL0680]|nr:hypothetical protein HDU91_004251 [Kappamyces sp. JEL0680]
MPSPPFECNSACELVFTVLFPIGGLITSLLIYGAPLPAVWAVFRTQKINPTLNPLPFAMALCNALAWLLYSFASRNWWVFGANIEGIPLGIFYILTCYPLSSRSDQATTMVLLLCFLTYLLTSAGISLISLSPESATNFLGWNGALVVVIFYGSPLSTMYHVIKSKSSASINPLISITTGINSTLWSLYGILVGDYFIAGPNLAGIVCSLAQLLLLSLYPRQPKLTEESVASSLDLLPDTLHSVTESAAVAV